MADMPVTVVGNNATGGNKKSQTLDKAVQILAAPSQATLGLGNASNRLRGGVFGANLGVQNYGVIPKMGG
jgi:hypothetical protein